MSRQTRWENHGSGAARWIVALIVLLAPCAAWVASGQMKESLPARNPLQPFANPTGLARTISTAGEVDRNNPFFQILGTNGRACITCHQPSTGWTLSPAEVRARFDRTGGLDPLFRTNDGSNSPWADVSTVESRRSAYSMLLSKGLIRVGMGIPSGAEFTLESADDPYGFASAAELSLFRRPLPSTNLKFLSAVMWDGRETYADQSIAFDLMDQANGATLGHAQASLPLTEEQREEIVSFETSLFTAQIYDIAAGDLSASNAAGGPKSLSQQEFYIGINDPYGSNPTGAVFNPAVFTDFDGWATGPGRGENSNGRNAARLAVARGQLLFNSKPIEIQGVKGLNDVLGVRTIQGTCGTCHDSPKAGDRG